MWNIMKIKGKLLENYWEIQNECVNFAYGYRRCIHIVIK